MKSRTLSTVTAVAAAIGYLIAIDAAHGQVVATLTGPPEISQYAGVTYSTDGKLVAAVGLSRHRGSQMGARNRPEPAPSANQNRIGVLAKMYEYVGHTVVVWDAATHQVVGTIEDAAYEFSGNNAATKVIGFIPNTDQIAVMSFIKQAYLLRTFNARTGKELDKRFPSLKTPANFIPLAIQTFAFSPDGKHLAIGGMSRGDNAIREICEREIVLFDVASGERRASYEVKGPVRILSFSPNSKYLMVGLASGQDALSLWDVGTGTRVSASGRREGGLRHAGFLPDGDSIRTVAESQSKLWAVPTFESRIVSGDWRDAGAIAYAKQGGLAAVCRGRTVSLYEANAKDPLGNLAGHDASCIEFSPDGKLLASAGGEDKVTLWECSSLRNQIDPKTTIKLAERQSGMIAFSQDSSLLGVMDVQKGEVALYNVSNQTRHGLIGLKPSENMNIMRPGETRSFRFLADGKHLACWRGTTVSIWSLADSKLASVVTHQTEKDEQVGFPVVVSDDGQMMAFNSRIKDRRGIRVFQSGTDRRLIESDLDDPVTFLNGNKKEIASAFCVWDIKDQSMVVSIPDEYRKVADRRHVTQLIPIGAERTVMLLTTEGSIAVVDLSNEEVSQPIPMYRRQSMFSPWWLNDFACSADGALVATSCRAGNCHLWERKTGRLLGVLNLHDKKSQGTCLAITPDKKLVACCASDGTLCIWDVASIVK